MIEPQITRPSRLSWSSVSTYSECGQKWLLTRGFKLPQATWFATEGGKVVHEITEAADRAGVKGVPWEDQLKGIPSFAHKFNAGLEELAESGIEVKPSGRKLTKLGWTGGPSKKDREWWLHHGPLMIDQWMNFKKAQAEKGWRIATMPDGQLGIEVGFDVMVNDVRLVGYIDRVYLLPDGSILVLDLKTGSLSPDLQLLTYAVGLEAEYGLSADWAAFWKPLPDSEVGELTSPVDVSQRPLQRLEKVYEQASRGINAGVFLPSVSSMCTSCTMKDFCWAVNGERSSEIPSEFEIFDPATGELLVA